MTDNEAEAVTNLGAHLAAAHEVIAEQLEIRRRLEGHLNQALSDIQALKEVNTRLTEELRWGQGCYQVALDDQVKCRRKVETMLEALEPARDYVADAASGSLIYVDSGPGYMAMAKEDLARIDAAITSAKGEPA